MIDMNDNIKDIAKYIPGKSIEEVQREYNLCNIIKLASNENNLGVPANVVEKVYAKLKDVYLYPDGGSYKIRQKLAEHFGLEDDQIIMGNGSDEILQIIALVYLNNNKTAIMSTNTFSEYGFVSRLANAQRIEVPLKNYKYDLLEMSNQIDDSVRLIFLCNPNNPTGTYFSHQELDLFLNKVPENILVVIDEAYYEYAYGDDYPNSLEFLGKYQNIIILRTFSKAYSLAGCRVGYAISSKKIIDSLNKARQPFNINSLAQEFVFAVLDEKDWIDKVRRMNEEQKKYLYQELDKLDCDHLKTKANFIFINIKRDAQSVFKYLLKKGLIIRPMNSFGYPQSIRVTVGLPEENKYFIECLKELYGAPAQD
jgi:histidinol-phosphate aminotransferase